MLLHDKFAGPFRTLVDRAVIEKNYYKQSSEYFAYQAKLTGRPIIDMIQPTSRHVRGGDDLEDCMFMRKTASFERFAREWVL